MNITRDIITDLLPAYLSGEASVDTRALVENFLAGDPAFAQEVEREWRQNLGLLGSMVPDLPPAPEKVAFEEAKRYLKTRPYLIMLGVIFTLLPFAITFSSEEGIQWLLWRPDFPFPAAVGISAVCAANAIIGWVGALVIGRRVRL